MAGATTGIVMGGLSLAQMISGMDGKNKAKRELANLEVPELENAFADIPISTLGSDLIREESARTTGSLVDASRAGGVRGVMSSIPRIMALNNQTNQEGRKYLDEQVIDRNFNIARDNVRIRDMVENRYMGDVQGLNNAIQGNRQDIWNGARGLGTATAYMQRGGLFGDDAQDEVPDPVDEGVNVNVGGTHGWGGRGH